MLLKRKCCVERLEAILRTSVFLRSKQTRILPLLFAFAILSFVVFITRPLIFEKKLQTDTAFKFFQNEDYNGFESWAKINGADTAYGVLKDYFKSSEPKAHDFAHIIGFVAVSESGIDGINVCDNLYNYGCYHGFMQIYLRENGISAVVQMEASCLKLGQASAPSCLHGIGHGLMMETSYVLDDALKNCEVLNVQNRTYCFDGVFMERIAGSMLPDEKKLKVTDENLFEPCKQVDNKYGKECWRNQVAIWFTYFLQDTAKVGAYCASLAREYWQTCFESLGFLLVQYKPANLTHLDSYCQIVNLEAHDYCILGEVKELLFEGKDVELAYNLCALVREASRQSCLSNYQAMYEEYQQRFSVR